MEARHRAVAQIRDGGFGTREIILRVNGIETPWGMADLHAAVEAADADPRIRLWAMIETPMGIINSREIAACAPDQENRLSCFVRALARRTS